MIKLLSVAALLVATWTPCHAWAAANDNSNANANHTNGNDGNNGNNGNNSTHEGEDPIAIAVGANCTNYPTPDAPRFTTVITKAPAEFISVHFTQFNLPADDYLVIRKTDAGVNSTDSVKIYGRERSGAFFSAALFNSTSVTLELFTTGDPTGNNVFLCPGFAIDKFRFLGQPAVGGSSGLEDVCGDDESVEAACTKGDPTVFKRTDAVIRLLIHKDSGSFFCTGWLLGCEGHMVTNNHCISTQADASNTEFEFRAQGDSCDTNCKSPLGCPGTVRARSAQLVFTSVDLDYTLVKLDINFSNDYGYLQLRESGAVLQETIYLVGHPAGYGKRVSAKDGSQLGSVVSTTQGGCLPNQVAYYLDTQGGSSGSPVLANKDNAVVALHHCGGCPNTAVNSNQLVADMRARNILPKCAVYGAAAAVTNPPVTAPPPTTTVSPPPTTTVPPPTTTPPAPTSRRSTTVDGTISTTASVVTIDYIDFALASDAIVELDVLSMEAKDGAYYDVNRDCNAGYIDSSIVLFQVNTDGSVSESTIIAINDDAPVGYGGADGSISTADSYIVRPLTAGRYRVAVGVSSMTPAQAVAKTMPLASSPRVCDTRLANYGSYRLTLSTTSDVTVSGPNSYIGSQCGNGDAGTQPYANCLYHREAPLTNVVALDGTIVRQAGSVSVDHIPFTMPAFGRVSIDLTSYESQDGYTYVDVNGFCSSGYIDAVAYVFRGAVGSAFTAADVINAVDDDDNFALRTRKGISFRDPFVSLALPAGPYVLVVGRYPMTVDAAITKVNSALPTTKTPEACGAPSNQGNYRVTFASGRAVAATAAGSFRGAQCPGNKGQRLCTANQSNGTDH